jgi:hypothetical protein
MTNKEVYIFAHMIPPVPEFPYWFYYGPWDISDIKEIEEGVV